MMRIGVLSDTHIGDEQVVLCETLAKVWGKVDLILHAGDVTSPAVIEELKRLAETLVVAGNMDGRAMWEAWPRERVVMVGRYQIGLTHGDFMRSMAGARFPPHWKMPRHFDAAALHAYLRSQFQRVDAIIFGHTHRPHNVRDGGVLFFNPGAWQRSEGGSSSIGLLTIDDPLRGEGGIRGEIIYLEDVR